MTNNDKEQKHTPAPWEVVYDAGTFDDSIGVAMASKLSDPTCYYSHHIWHSEMDSEEPSEDESGSIEQYEEAIANAHLIAAAPDMYDVLKRLAFYHGPGTCPDDIFEDMHLALKKAEGKS